MLANINKELLIACGGFISQLLLIFILYLFRNNLNIITYNLFISYSIILILFNILPIIPLDGNKIFHLLLEKFFSYHLAYYLNLYISLIILVIFIFINYIYKIDNYFIITFLIYEVFIYYKNYLYLEKRFLLERYLDDFEYHKIDNNTKSIRDLRKNVLHYFKENNHYIKEKDKIRDKLFDK